jgi:hypothetical protein
LKKDKVELTSSLPDRHMGAFQTEYRYLSNSHPDLGSIATLYWDEAVFGFPVSDLRIGVEPPTIADIPLLRKALLDYCERTRSELISVRVPAPQTSMSAVLSGAGFVYVDFALIATLAKLDPASLRKTAFILRRAEAADHDAIYHIGENAFHFGRYHTDPYFPRELANRRYVQWVRRALSGSDPDDVVFVLGGPGKVIGFMHVALHDGSADLRLGAVTQGSSLGFWLYIETLRAVHALGAKSVSTGISAANVRVMQIYSALGFRFTHPELILHWHSPDAAHLNPELRGV